jgi:hypothetical protein
MSSSRYRRLPLVAVAGLATLVSASPGAARQAPDSAALAQARTAQAEVNGAITAYPWPRSMVARLPGDDPCVSRFTLTSKAPGPNGARPQPRPWTIEWRKSATMARMNPETSEGTWVYFPQAPVTAPLRLVFRSRATAQKFVDNVNALVRACTTAAPVQAMAPAAGSRFSDAQLSIRDPLPLESWEHAPKCRFRALPNFQLTETDPRIDVVASASYFINPREAPGSKVEFETLLQNSPGDANWQGIYAQSSFNLHHPSLTRARMLRARLLLDGRDSGLPLVLDHGRGLDSPWSIDATVEIDEEDQDRLLTAVAAARVAVLELYGSGATPAITWTFDVSTLRELPRALRLTSWRCR